MLSVLVWWLTLQIIALAGLPAACALLRFLPSRGLGLVRQMGLLLCAYVFWLFVSLGLFQNTTANALACVLALGAVSWLIWVRKGCNPIRLLREHKRFLIANELLFAGALAAFALFRAYNPEIAATEKPMEFGFLNAILRSRTFPPRDPWLSGYGISYYYLGYVMMALLTELSGLASDVSFNLMGVTVFALTVGGSFSLGFDLAQARLARRREDGEKHEGQCRSAAIWVGLLAAVLVALIGNWEGVFELVRAHGGGSAALWEWLDVRNLRATAPSATWYPDDPWWWWRASRVIHDRGLDGHSIEVIDEFPFFSFLLGDNHPHVLGLPFAILAVGLSLNLWLNPGGDLTDSLGIGRRMMAFLPRGIARRFEMAVDAGASGLAVDWAEPLVWGVLFGGLGFLNTWDFPIYLGLFVLVYALRRLRSRPGAIVSNAVWLGAILLGLGVLLYWPFYLGFRSQAGGIGWVGSIKTRLHQYLLMFGTFIIIGSGFLVMLCFRSLRSAASLRSSREVRWGVLLLLLLAAEMAIRGWWTSTLCVVLIAMCLWAAISVLRSDRVPTATSDFADPRLFVLVLLFVGLMLTLAVEFVFLRDTFGTRMNTVFKFYYQAWLLMGIASAYGAFDVADTLAHSRTISSRFGLVLWGSIVAVCVMVGLCYTIPALVSKAGGFRGQATLDGTAYVASSRPDEYAAIVWLRAHAEEDAIMLEAPGGSYTEYNWVSAHTGIPTVLGWGGHELQWRGSYDEPSAREPVIATIYQSRDLDQVVSLLERYGVDYLYVGPRERQKYGLRAQDLQRFDRIMRRVFESGQVVIYGRAR